MLWKVHIPDHLSGRKETRDVHVLLLEYFNGISLFDFAYAHHFTFPTATKQKIVSQLLDMVDILHSHGVFHLDLIAGNFLIKDSSAGDLQLRIIDFEFAKLATQDTERRLLQRWRYFDRGDLEETLKNMKLMDEEEPLKMDGRYDAISEFLRR